MTKPKKPWRLDTNSKYVEVIKTILGLSTGSLLLPIFLTRNLLVIPSNLALKELLSWHIYLAWSTLGLSIGFAILYQYLSAKWVRIAWGKEAGIFFSKNTKEVVIEKWMEWSFWICIIGFILGLVFSIWFMADVKIPKISQQ